MSKYKDPLRSQFSPPPAARAQQHTSVLRSTSSSSRYVATLNQQIMLGKQYSKENRTYSRLHGGMVFIAPSGETKKSLTRIQESIFQDERYVRRIVCNQESGLFFVELFEPFRRGRYEQEEVDSFRWILLLWKYKSVMKGGGDHNDFLLHSAMNVLTRERVQIRFECDNALLVLLKTHTLIVCEIRNRKVIEHDERRHRSSLENHTPSGQKLTSIRNRKHAFQFEHSMDEWMQSRSMGFRSSFADNNNNNQFMMEEEGALHTPSLERD
eukprot:PhF_6_TR6112/c0_g1_i1/m.9019